MVYVLKTHITLIDSLGEKIRTQTVKIWGFTKREVALIMSGKMVLLTDTM